VVREAAREVVRVAARVVATVVYLRSEEQSGRPKCER
jgi:hypothetical protein